jgi:hypothetical protein
VFPNLWLKPWLDSGTGPRWNLIPLDTTRFHWSGVHNQFWGGLFYPSSSLGLFLGGISGSCPAPPSRNTTQWSTWKHTSNGENILSIKLGLLHAPPHYQWKSIEEKNELILWKLSFTFNENYIEWICIM